MKLFKKVLIAPVLAAACILTLVGCETEDDKKIASAQACLDAARSASDATACVAKVDGVESPGASLIRCGGTYIQQGFTTTKFTNAYDKLKNAPSGTDPMLAMISEVAFTGTNPATARTNVDDATYAATECKKSESEGLTWLSSTTKIATTIYSLGSVSASNPTSFLNALVGTNDTATLTAIGNATLDAYNAQCVGSSAATTTACTDFGNAIAQAGGDPLAIANQLKTLLAN